MDWDVNYLLIHVLALAGVCVLSRRTPDLIQLTFLILAGAAMLVYIGADVAALAGYDPVWPIRLVASRVEHTAMLLYLFRQVWIKSEICRSLKSSSSAAT